MRATAGTRKTASLHQEVGGLGWRFRKNGSKVETHRNLKKNGTLWFQLGPVIKKKYVNVTDWPILEICITGEVVTVQDGPSPNANLQHYNSFTLILNLWGSADRSSCFCKSQGHQFVVSPPPTRMSKCPRVRHSTQNCSDGGQTPCLNGWMWLTWSGRKRNLFTVFTLLSDFDIWDFQWSMSGRMLLWNVIFMEQMLNF